MNPFKFGQLMKHLVRAKQKKPDLPEVFRASEAQIPEKTLTRDMFKEAQERFKNAKAGGGMLVQPGFGGTRQGYRSEKTQAVKRGGDKELLLRLVKKANQGFKYVKRKDLQVQAGYKRSTNITAKEIGLDTLKTKFKKAFDFVMGNPNKLVKDMFDPMTKVKKLVETNEAVGRYLKDYAPYEESRRLIKVLAAPRSKSFLQKAEGLTLGDLEFRIDNNIKGDNLFAPPKQVTAETKIMEIVDRHIKQGGKKIKWTVKPEITKGGYPSFGESRFIYNGKEYGMGELINEARDDPNFKEFFKAQRDYKTLNDKIVTHPKTGEKIRFGNLMKEVYGDSVVPYNIDHVKSIVEEPFTSLRILPARINKAAGNIIQMDEKFITNPELKDKYTKQGKEAQLKKIGYNFNQPVEDLIQAELKLADDVLNKGRVLRKPNQIVESIRKGENYVPDFYSKTAKPGVGFERQLNLNNLEKQIAELASEIDPNNCGRKTGATGGRVGLRFGSTECAIKAKNYINQTVERGVLNEPPARVGLIKKIISGTGNFIKQGLNPSELFKLENLVGKSALYATAAIESGLLADDVLRKKEPINVAAAENFLVGNLLNLDADAERAKNIINDPNLSPAAKTYAQGIIDQDNFRKLSQTYATNLVKNPLFIASGAKAKADTALENLKNKIKNTPETGRMDYESLLADKQDAFTAKEKPFDAPDKPGLPSFTSGQLEKRNVPGEFVIDPSFPLPLQKETLVPSYVSPSYSPERPEYETNEFLNQYLKSIGQKPLRPGEGTLFRMNTPQLGLFGTQERFAGGGIAKLAGVDSGPPPASGPNSQGLQGLMKRVRNR